MTVAGCAETSPFEQGGVWAALGQRCDPTVSRPALDPAVEIARFDYRFGPHAVIGRSDRSICLTVSMAEAALAERLDGSRTVAELAADTAAKSEPVDVVSLVESLRRQELLAGGFIDVDDALARALHPMTRWRRFARAIQTTTVHWRGADAATRRLYRAGGGFWFTSVGLAVAAVLIVAGAAALLAVLADEGIALKPQNAGWELGALLVMDFVLVLVHEFGHAAALVRYDRTVSGAGVHLYFGSPAFFIESADVLLLPRRQRIVQALAGPYFEAVLTAGAAILLWVHPDGTVGQLLYRFVIVNVFVLWLNLVPLLELDGYWVLSDTIEYPDLRPRSLTFVRRELWHKLQRRERLGRHERFLAAYGIGGIVFTVVAVCSAVLFWQSLFGDLVSSLIDAGPTGIVVLFIGFVLLFGPLARSGAAIGGRALAFVRSRRRRRRFAAERAWRVEAAKSIAALPLFDGLTAAALGDLAGRVQLRRCGLGEPLVTARDRADAFYVVRSGTFDVLDDDGAGRTTLLGRLHPGDGFGEIALMVTGYRTATVRAATAAEAFHVDRSTFERLLAERAARLPDHAPTTADLTALAGLAPFSQLGIDELLLVARHGRWRSFAPGDDAVVQGDRAMEFFAVANGRFSVTVDGAAVGELGAGDHFGELGLLTDGHRSATVSARTPGRAFVVDADGFRAVVAGRFRRARHRPLATATRYR